MQKHFSVIILFFSFFRHSFEVLAVHQRKLQAVPTAQPSSVYVAPSVPEETVTKVPSPLPSIPSVNKVTPGKNLTLQGSPEKQNTTTTDKKQDIAAEKSPLKGLNETFTISEKNNDTLRSYADKKQNTTTPLNLAVADNLAGDTLTGESTKSTKKEIERIEKLQFRFFLLIIIISILGVTYLVRKF